MFEVQTSKKIIYFFSFLVVVLFNSFPRVCKNKLSTVPFSKSKKFTPLYLASNIRNSLLFFQISLAFVSQFFCLPFSCCRVLICSHVYRLMLLSNNLFVFSNSCLASSLIERLCVRKCLKASQLRLFFML